MARISPNMARNIPPMANKGVTRGAAKNIAKGNAKHGRPEMTGLAKPFEKPMEKVSNNSEQTTLGDKINNFVGNLFKKD